MADSIPLQIAETLQTAHINQAPSRAHDANPSTAASKKEPVHLEPVSSYIEEEEDDLPSSALGVDDEDEVNSDLFTSSYQIKPRPRKSKKHQQQLPPMPDLRFEQSYLASIRNADTWWKVGLITARDQLFMPLVQGVVYNLFICGWQHWNKNAQLHGSSIGARVRRWWYGVNNWKIPEQKLRR
ncbi:hypothetical protein QBC35DRAFT_490200 [Podospora australis]|uniref:DUF1770 domain-containing protein n=1 Tax=Podospora australis TaxID=1536484 RepID=A0AAN6WY33_9PEZI|nr:hypothetical protein QBC35DRAFT_490200 [Podospora australis]